MSSPSTSTFLLNFALSVPELTFEFSPFIDLDYMVPKFRPGDKLRKK